MGWAIIERKKKHNFDWYWNHAIMDRFTVCEAGGGENRRLQIWDRGSQSEKTWVPSSCRGWDLPQVVELKYLRLWFTSKETMEPGICRLIGAAAATLRILSVSHGQKGPEPEGKAIDLPVNLRSYPSTELIYFYFLRFWAPVPSGTKPSGQESYSANQLPAWRTMVWTKHFPCFNLEQPNRTWGWLW